MTAHRRRPLGPLLRATLAFGATLCLYGARPSHPAHAQESGEAVAIVVHRGTTIDNLSFDALRSIFLGDRQFWPGGNRITLLMRAPVAAERKVVLERIYRMNEGQFRQYWIAKLFRAEVANGPKIFYSSEMARELVNAIPGAIAFMPASEIGPTLKILRIDGKGPDEPGYPLR